LTANVKRKESEMKKVLLLSGLVFFFLMFCSLARASEDLSTEELFINKCTQCHDAAKSKNLHGSKTYFIDIIKKMQAKKGAVISDKDAEALAKMLGDPNREAFEKKCSKCHSLDRLDKKHLTGKTAKQIIENMGLKGADITPEEKQYIEKVLRYYYKLDGGI